MFEQTAVKVNGRSFNMGDLLHLLEIIGMLVALVGGWYRFDYRVTRLEDVQQREVPALERLAKDLDKLDQQLLDYPLHRHVNGDIEYPAGTNPPAALPDRRSR